MRPLHFFPHFKKFHVFFFLYFRYEKLKFKMIRPAIASGKPNFARRAKRLGTINHRIYYLFIFCFYYISVIRLF